MAAETQTHQPENNRNANVVRHRRKWFGRSGTETYDSKQEKKALRERAESERGIGRKAVDAFRAWLDADTLGPNLSARAAKRAERERDARADHLDRQADVHLAQEQEQAIVRAHNDLFHPAARENVSRPVNAGEAAYVGEPEPAQANFEGVVDHATVMQPERVSASEPAELPAPSEINRYVDAPAIGVAVVPNPEAYATPPMDETSPLVDYRPVLAAEEAQSPVAEQAAVPVAKAEYQPRHAAKETGPFVDYQPVAKHEVENEPPFDTYRDGDHMTEDEARGFHEANQELQNAMDRGQDDDRDRSRTYDGTRSNEGRHRAGSDMTPADEAAPNAVFDKSFFDFEPVSEPSNPKSLNELATSGDALKHRLRSKTFNSRRSNDTISGRNYTPKHAEQYDELTMPRAELPVSIDDAQNPIFNETGKALSVVQNRLNSARATARNHIRHRRSFVNHNHRQYVNH